MELYVDYREDKQRVELIKKEFPSFCGTKALVAGDILVIQDDNPTICIETKTLQDFIGSCRNGQIKKEALKNSSKKGRHAKKDDDYEEE